MPLLLVSPYTRLGLASLPLVLTSNAQLLAQMLPSFLLSSRQRHQPPIILKMDRYNYLPSIETQNRRSGQLQTYSLPQECEVQFLNLQSART